MSISVSPYVLFRRNRLPFAELSRISFAETWALLDEMFALRAEAAQLADALSDLVAEVVPTVDKSVRAELVRLRRDIHNQRHERAADRIAQVEGHLDASLLSRLRHWLDVCERASQRERKSIDVFAREKVMASKELIALLEHDAMGKSIQLSGSQLYRSLVEFSTNGPQHYKPSKVRNFESTLVNFVYRASLKPSPFGHFTEVGAFSSSISERRSGDRARGGEESVATLNRFLLDWIVSALPQMPGGVELGKFMLNSTTQTDATMVQFIGTAASAPSSGESRPGSEIVRVKRSAVVDRLVDLLADGPVTGRQLLQRLAEIAGDETLARRILMALTRTGMIFYRTGIDDQDPEYSHKLADFLAGGETPEVANVAREFAVLRDAEMRFPDASVEQRGSLLDSATGAIENIAGQGNVTLPPSGLLRGPVYEDVATQELPDTWDREAVTGNLETLESLWRFASLLDVGQVKRLGLYAFAAQRFGDRVEIPFLEFFTEFAQLSEQAQWSVFTGQSCDLTTRFAEQRAAALAELYDRMSLDEDVLRLDPQHIRDACAQVENSVDPDSITFRLQLANKGASQRQLVVNGVFTGYGTFYSRFSEFVPGTEDWSLRTALSEHLRESYPNQVDLHAVLGFNFNLHPPLTDKAIVYPGSVSNGGFNHLYGVDQLWLRLDHDTKSLVLWDADRGEPIELLPMNFLLPIGAPVMYQLLESLSPTTLHTWQPMNDLRNSGYFHEYPASFPRLEVGDVVADRQTWTVAANEIPGLEELTQDSYAAMLRFDEWRRAKQLPQHAFVLCQTLSEFNTLAGRTTEVSHMANDMERLNKASVHKPMYVDFRNPYLLRSFARFALSRADVFVSIRECLPSVEDYVTSPRVDAAEEFFVELNRNTE